MRKDLILQLEEVYQMMQVRDNQIEQLASVSIYTLLYMFKINFIIFNNVISLYLINVCMLLLQSRYKCFTLPIL